MSETKRPGAYFDVDGTIFKSSVLEKVVDRGIEVGVFEPDTFQKAANLRQQWQYENSEETYLRYLRVLVGGYVTKMAGVSVEAFDQITDDVVAAHRVRRFKFPRIIMDELAGSHHNIAISGSPGRIVKKFVDDMPFIEVVGSDYETEDGFFTGRAISTPDKAEVRERLIQEKGLLALGDVAVGDTVGDKSILEAVEFPIMFNPSATLAAHGKALGWPMVLEQKDNISVIEVLDAYQKGESGGYVLSDIHSLIDKILRR